MAPWTAVSKSALSSDLSGVLARQRTSPALMKQKYSYTGHGEMYGSWKARPHNRGRNKLPRSKALLSHSWWFRSADCVASMNSRGARNCLAVPSPLQPGPWGPLDCPEPPRTLHIQKRLGSYYLSNIFVGYIFCYKSNVCLKKKKIIMFVVKTSNNE